VTLHKHVLKREFSDVGGYLGLCSQDNERSDGHCHSSGSHKGVSTLGTRARGNHIEGLQKCTNTRGNEAFA
jgi:hypothetical protein